VWTKFNETLEVFLLSTSFLPKCLYFTVFPKYFFFYWFKCLLITEKNWKGFELGDLNLLPYDLQKNIQNQEIFTVYLPKLSTQGSTLKGWSLSTTEDKKWQVFYPNLLLECGKNYLDNHCFLGKYWSLLQEMCNYWKWNLYPTIYEMGHTNPLAATSYQKFDC